jgi:hypothetical protein
MKQQADSAKAQAETLQAIQAMLQSFAELGSKVDNTLGAFDSLKSDTFEAVEALKKDTIFLSSEVERATEESERFSQSRPPAETAFDRRKSVAFGLPASRIFGDPQKTLLLTPHTVPDRLKLKPNDKNRITVKEVMQLMDDYAGYKNSSVDDSKSLTDHISLVAAKLLVDDQLLHKTDLSGLLTYANFHQLPDDLALKVVARIIRPESDQQLRDLLFQHAPSPVPVWERFNVGVQNWDQAYWKPFNKHIQQAEDLLNMFYNHASPDELKGLPEIVWGSKDHPGLIQIALQALGETKENASFYTGEKELKKCNSIAQFYILMRKFNDDLASGALELRKLNSRFIPPPKLIESHQAVQDKSMQQKFQSVRFERNGLPEKIWSQTPAVGEEHPRDSGKTLSLVDATNRQLFPRPSPGELTCNEMARTGTCTRKDCYFSHDPDKIRTTVMRRAEELASSPFLPKALAAKLFCSQVNDARLLGNARQDALIAPLDSRECSAGAEDGQRG